MRLHSCFTFVMGLSLLCFGSKFVHAEEVLGTGTEALIGGDLTDPENDGDPEMDIDYNAVFRAAFEEGFGGGEFAFNVFDNVLGPGNAKWCCGSEATVVGDPIWVEAQFTEPYFLTRFTVSSANDVPARDPIHWAVQGSNDGVNYETIFEHDGDSLWTERLQVISFSAGDDFPIQETAYQVFRHVTYNTESWPNGAYYQVGEIEFFGETSGRTPGDFNADGAVDLGDFTILTENFNQSFSFDVSFSRGDSNGDGNVDLEDFAIFRDVYTGQGGGGTAAAVPEPSGASLLCAASLVFLVRKRRVR